MRSKLGSRYSKTQPLTPSSALVEGGLEGGSQEETS